MVPTLRVRARESVRVAFEHARPVEGQAPRFVGLDADGVPVGAVEVQATAYYRRKVLHGDLVAADAATARACGVLFFPSDSEVPS